MSKNNSSWGADNIIRALNSPDAHVHFLGVGGVSMSSLFCLTRHFGISASGSDAHHGEYVDALAARGEDVSVTDGCTLPDRTTLLVYSIAVSDDDPTIMYAEGQGIPCVSRAEYLGALMRCYTIRIGVSGSHGKSTVTAMLAHIFTHAGLCPTVMSGAAISDSGECYSLGSLDYLIYEACEYKDSFLCFLPSIALLLNIDYDHVDYFDSVDAVADSFARAARGAGLAVMNGDDGKLLKISEKLHTPPILFGKNKDFDYCYEVLSATPRAMRFSLSHRGARLGEIELSMLGEFNICNAVAATVCAIECGIEFSICANALRTFHGIGRRLELIGSFNGRSIYYDYAHHPTEIEAGINAIKGDTGAPVTVIFGPHTYSRTEKLWCGFVKALSYADHVILTDIAAIREQVRDGVTSDALALECGGKVCRTSDELLRAISDTEGSIAIMGAADMSWVKNILLCG